MDAKFYKHWLVVFIVLFVVDFLWHGAIFSKFYAGQLEEIGRFAASGKLSPLIAFLAIGDILVSLGYTYFVTAVSATTKKYVTNGFVAGLVITGSFTMFNHAILNEWGMAITLADLAYGIVAGLVLGCVLMWLKKEKSAPSAM